MLWVISGSYEDRHVAYIAAIWYAPGVSSAVGRGMRPGLERLSSCRRDFRRMWTVHCEIRRFHLVEHSRVDCSAKGPLWMIGSWGPDFARKWPAAPRVTMVNDYRGGWRCGALMTNFRYWKRFLPRRRRFIEEVIDRLAATDTKPAHRGRMITALKAARGRNPLIEPELCAGYLDAWRADRRVWRRFMTRSGPEKALAALGVPHELDRGGGRP